MFSSPMSVRKANDQNSRTSSTEAILEDIDVDTGYYVHQKKLGEGGFGSVRLATHLKTGQKVAIKMMNKVKLGNDLFRIKTEIKALKSLNHKNIAKLLQVFETDNDIYLVLEYCSGGELFDYLVSKGRLTEDEARDIFWDLVDVLDYIHSRGVAHRDLKPENILFDCNHKIKLIDFGLSALYRDSTKPSARLQTCCGSPAYAAPELFKETGYSGPDVDVWSAGVLLYALLVGRLPFEHDNLASLYGKIQLGIYAKPRNVSKNVQNLIDSMLQTDPKNRIKVKDIRRHEWLEVNNDSAKNVVTSEPNKLLVLEICHQMFPELSMRQLEQNISNKFGYKTATFRVITNNPVLFESLRSNLKPVVQRRRSRSADQNTDKSSKIIGSKRKIDFNTFKVFHIKDQLNKTQPKVSLSSPTRIPVLRSPALQSPQVMASLGLPKQKLSTACAVTPAKNARILTPNNANNNNSNNCSAKAPAVLTTPPKKSFMRRLFETATPVKNRAPRLITGLSGEKNITLTQFTDPKECLEKLVETLKARNVVCTLKSSFSLRCVLSSMNTIVLVFSLEICRYGEKFAIHRNRLKGDFWNYKKICEDIIKISNESIP